MLGIHALHASLSLLLELGMETVSRLVLDNAAFLLERLGQLHQLELVTPMAQQQYAGIITFRLRETASAHLWQYLSERGVVCAQRAGGIRFSPHFYNKKERLEEVVKLISDYKS
jgi:selenocysteine lyase/cysteine desulfurase